MRGLWITLVPMLVAAALVLWGGERMARREVEERVPADRDRLFDFTAAFRGELDRLDRVYENHLAATAGYARWMERDDLARHCGNLIGLRSVHIFKSGRKDDQVDGAKPPIGMAASVPEVVAEGEAGRVISRRAAVISGAILGGSEITGGWLSCPQPGYRLRWFRAEPGRLVVLLIDDSELAGQLEPYLGAWLENPLAPLREAGERVAIEGPGGREWLSSAGRAGPAAMVLPHRNGLGEWQVLAWDKLSVTKTHDPATLLFACGIAGALILAGAILQIQQGRALRLAEERVSFVNRVSHELGTPLTNILLNLDLAGRSLEARPAEAQRRLSLVHEEVRRLGRLVANVLTFSRGERKSLDLAPAACIPDQVVEDMLAQFQPSLDRRKVRVEWQRGASDSTRLDPDALAQITGNLISNVEKYASTGGWIGIGTEMENGRLRIRIADHGPGIPAKFRAKVFEPFERVHGGVSEGSSGTGLGLAIARDLARRMGGDLLLRSSEKGAVFELDLPAPPHLALVHPEVA